MGMRPNYHISPKHGFLNDPNGLAQFQGKYHVFYQWLPDVVPQGNKIWRHCVSEDPDPTSESDLLTRNAARSGMWAETGRVV